MLCYISGDNCHRRELIEQSLAIEPNDFAAQNNLAEVYKSLGEFDKALSHARRSLELKPGFAPAHACIAEALLQLGQIHEAGEHAKTAVTVAPNDPNAHLIRARCLLLNGQLTHAWPEYEWRLRKFPQLRRQLPMQRWTGGKITGKSILLTAEQGFGDTIQFVRYANVLADRDAEVYVECHGELQRLVSQVGGVVSAVAVGQSLPRCDFHIPLPSLPLAFNTSIKTIPVEIPYLSPHPKLMDAWREMIKSDSNPLKIGLACAGRRTHEMDRHRSCPPELLAPLASIENVTFYSLQKESKLAESDPLKVIDLTMRMSDFADTAGLIANLDLVITVDTAVAHLAGAMNKPVWIMLPFAPEWRWMLTREDSPWYPTAKLFRQPIRGDWNSVIESMCEELTRFTPPRN